MLSVLLLLALSSTSLQDVVKKLSQDGNDLEDRAPEISANRSVGTFQRLLSPAARKQKRQANPLPSAFNDNGKLKWRRWAGSLPDGAVSIYNKYADRYDYVCKYGCNAGFYTPNKGSNCHYPYGDKEYPVSSFDILVNEDNFEILEWKDDSYGSVPQHSIRTCSNDILYVGKNKYGLGKVHPVHQAFFLPWEGKEYWYKSYKVLTINKDVESELISDVRYNTDAADIVRYPPETMDISTITNNECSEVSKTATLEKRTTVQKTWNVGGSVTLGVRKTFTGGVPFTASGSVEISGEVSFQASGGITNTEEFHKSVSVTLNVPPNHSCSARMVGHKYNAKIPFSARLSRTYRDGQTKWTSISGTYDSVSIGKVHTEVDRCQPVANAKPCPQRRS